MWSKLWSKFRFLPFYDIYAIFSKNGKIPKPKCIKGFRICFTSALEGTWICLRKSRLLRLTPSQFVAENASLKRFLYAPTLSGFESLTLKHKKQRIPVWVSVVFGALEGTRTPDLLVRSQTLYPAELPARLHLNAKVYYHLLLSLSTKI